MFQKVTISQNIAFSQNHCHKTED